MELEQYINSDRIKYLKPFSKEQFLDWLLRTEQYYIRSFLRNLRKEEYYTFLKPNKFLRYYYARKKNILGRKLGFFIPAGCFDLGLNISHYGSIIINPKSRIGKNCTLHGNCCIGNNGNDELGSPEIGDNVDLGQNSQILGPIKIANHVKVGSGSIVLKSVSEEGVTVVGIPGKQVYQK